MTEIYVKVRGASAVARKTGPLVAGTVGMPAHFSFDDKWAGLNVIAVFEGSGVSKSVPLLNETSVTVPWECLMKAKTSLRIGLEGRLSDGSIVIPTAWANVGYIEPGAKATDDLAQEPSPTPFDILMAAVAKCVTSVNGVAPDENGNVVVQGGGSGITAAEKELILSLFRNAAYTADMSATISRLESLWSGSGDEPDAPVEPDIPDEPSVITHNVTKKLDGVSASNSATSVVNGASYVCNLTAHDGYTLDGAEVSVAMGGKDITSTAYSNGVINIAAVTGDVDITVVAKEIRIYSVTNNLTGVTNSNPQTEVTEGFYSASLSWESGYQLNSLVITMGGVDITADVYGEGNILITEVTGDIVITAEAGLPAPVYLLENKTFDGSAGQIIDTGIALFDTQKDWSIYIALTTSDESRTSGRAACWHKSVESTYPNAVNVGRGQWNTNWFVRAVTVQYQVSDNLAKCAVIITHTKEKNTHKYYGVVGGEIVTGDLPSRGVGTDGTLKIGGSYDYAETKEAELFIGTINTAEVHLRVLTEAEIKEKLGVA